MKKFLADWESNIVESIQMWSVLVEMIFVEFDQLGVVYVDGMLDFAAIWK